MVANLKGSGADMLGSASWSTTVSVSKKFARMNVGKQDVNGNVKDKRVLLVCDNQVKATSIRHLSKYSGEDEVLSSKDVRYKFVSIKTSGEYIEIHVTSEL